MRQKRQYRWLPKKPRTRRFGWQGLARFMGLCTGFAVPEFYFAWRWSKTNDPYVFGLLTISLLILFVIFCVIARPWEEGP